MFSLCGPVVWYTEISYVGRESLWSLDPLQNSSCSPCRGRVVWYTGISYVRNEWLRPLYPLQHSSSSLLGYLSGRGAQELVMWEINHCEHWILSSAALVFYVGDLSGGDSQEFVMWEMINVSTGSSPAQFMFSLWGSCRFIHRNYLYGKWITANTGSSPAQLKFSLWGTCWVTHKK